MPIPILDVSEIRAAEREADADGLPYGKMMERAGRAIAYRVIDLLTQSEIAIEDRIVLFLIGPGNNGNDGLIAASTICEMSPEIEVRCYLVQPRPETDPYLQAVRSAGARLAVATRALADIEKGYPSLNWMIWRSRVVVDAVYGIGARLPLDETSRTVLTQVRESIRIPMPDSHSFADVWSHNAMKCHVLALDCPSGLDCDTGALDEASLPADETITMIAAKPGLLTFPGAVAVGRLAAADLGVEKSVTALIDARDQIFTASDAAGLLPPRPPNSHKGTFGRVLVVGGSANYPGAPALAALAACRGGAGLVTVGVAEPLVAWLAGALPECTWLQLPHEAGAITAEAVRVVDEQSPTVQALVVGMGLGRAVKTAAFLDRLLEQRSLPPLILDADGLSLLATLSDWPGCLPPETVLTPHPGEMARLCGLSAQEVNANRWALARENAATWNAVLVLKGAHTVVANPDGRLRVLPFKTSALATAGTGDVLAGMIGSLRAQGLTAFDAASTAAWWHGAAGMLAAERVGTTRGVTASDVIAAIPAVFANGER